MLNYYGVEINLYELVLKTEDAYEPIVPELASIIQKSPSAPGITLLDPGAGSRITMFDLELILRLQNDAIANSAIVWRFFPKNTITVTPVQHLISANFPITVTITDC